MLAWSTSGVAAVRCPDTNVPEPRDDQALLYFIRPDFMLLSLKIFIYADETLLGVLRNDSYTFAYVEPGQRLLWFNVAWDALTIEAEAGTTRYFLIYDHFDEVDEDVGPRMIQDAASCVLPEDKEREKAAKHIANVYPKVLAREGIHVGGVPPATAPPPRVIARLDGSLLALPNGGGKGGGGITIPIGGTGAGLMDTFGLDVGAEVRLWRWIALDGSTGRYQPELHVARDRGSGVMTDVRSATVDLETLKFGVILTPPKWRGDWARGAIGLLWSTMKVGDVPPELGILVEETDSGIGVDFRGDFLFSKNRHWGVGAALSFENLGPRFVDLETGYTGSLQVSGFFFRFGVRGAW
jgi:hypothetical protein